MILKIILIVIGTVIGYLIFMTVIGARILRKFVHFPAPFFVGYFLDSNFRRRLQPPDKVIRRSGIGKNMTILEIGCGSGAYTTYIAREGGDRGKVYALDIQPNMLK
jgi:2-polyprenyl-3-methyl-5-hydroxy-6-metoxy-1,4-benzoquinol methylase